MRNQGEEECELDAEGQAAPSNLTHLLAAGWKGYEFREHS